jgi:hypothetical protein
LPLLVNWASGRQAGCARSRPEARFPE